MSQEKVNQYKEAKKNRKETALKAKKKSFITKVCVGVVGAILVGWLGYSAVVSIQNAQGPTVTVDTNAVTEYVNGL